MRKLFAAFVGIFLCLPLSEAFAQQCATAEGTWSDSYSQTWPLAQSGGFIFGDVLSPGAPCGNSWPVWGTYNGNGEFSVQADNPFPADGCSD
jgi:hypothetical protein